VNGKVIVMVMFQPEYEGRMREGLAVTGLKVNRDSVEILCGARVWIGCSFDGTADPLRSPGFAACRGLEKRTG